MVRALGQIRQLRPRPWWFIVAPVVAFALAELRIVLWALRGTEHVAIAMFILSIVLIHGLVWFPVGIWGVFVWDLQLYTEYGGIFCYVGWSFYLVLIAAGLQYPRKLIFFALVILLVLNIVGFQTEHIRSVACPDLMW